MRLLLVLLWFAFIATAAYWLPAYDDGDFTGEELYFLPAYAVIAALTAIGMRGKLETARAAVRSTWAAIVLLAAAGLWGLVQNTQAVGERGGYVYTYVGIALWTSWVALMLSTAGLSRTKWDGFAGIAVTFLVAALGFVFIVARPD